MLIYNMAISATANLGPVTTVANIGQPASLAERAVKARSGRFDPDQYPSHRHFSQLLRKLDLCGSYSQTQPGQAVHVQRLVIVMSRHYQASPPVATGAVHARNTHKPAALARSDPVPPATAQAWRTTC